MKVESYQYYEYGNYMPVEFGISTDHEFGSIHECAVYFRILMKSRPDAENSFIVWLDNWRYLYVTRKSYDVHYHAFYSTSDLKIINNEN